MATINYLYIDDDKNAHGIVKNIENEDLEFNALLPKTWNEQIEDLIDNQSLNNYKGLLLDLKLEFTNNERETNLEEKLENQDALDKKKLIKFSGADLAQTIRTSIKAGKGIKDLPIFLCSTDNLFMSYLDRTSFDLFDRKLNKTLDFKTKESTRKIFIEYSKAYEILLESDKIEDFIKKNIDEDEELNILKSEISKCHTSHEKIYLLDRHFIAESGSLLDEKLLAVRLGIDIESSTYWHKFLNEVLHRFEYKGILSEVYDRWWNRDIIEFLRNELNINLKILDSSTRVELLKNHFSNYDLKPIPLLKDHEFSTYWYKCAISDQPLDILDGLRTIEMPRYPWIEHKYVSKNYLLSDERDMERINLILGPNEKLILRELELE